MRLLLLYIQKSYLRHKLRRTEKAIAHQKAINAILRQAIAQLQQD